MAGIRNNTSLPKHITRMPRNHRCYVLKPKPIRAILLYCDAIINTDNGGLLEGKAGEYLVEGIDGKLYFAPKESFEEIYEEIRIGRR